VSDLREFVQRAREAIAPADGEDALERLRAELLGRRSPITEAFATLRTIEGPLRAEVGRAANEAKKAIEEALAARSEELARVRLADLAETEAIDVTFPGKPPAVGRRHVLTVVQREIETVMERMGYHVETGPEVETDWYNFEALNLPAGHASRDMQDTFFFSESEDLLLRTHTSPMQIRSMERLKQPPIYVIIPGRTYRRDATDPSHLAQFMQLEALAIDEGLTVGDLKGTILYFAQSLWGPDRQVRIRPHSAPRYSIGCAGLGPGGARAKQRR
jgi:phenylalanyl-tRNA synthetase alpha chain